MRIVNGLIEVAKAHARRFRVAFNAILKGYFISGCKSGPRPSRPIVFAKGPPHLTKTRGPAFVADDGQHALGFALHHIGPSLSYSYHKTFSAQHVASAIALRARDPAEA